MTKAERELRQLLAARVLLVQNLTAEARALLAQVRPGLAAERHSFAAWMQLLQWGELALDLGDTQLAVQIAQRALKQIAADPTPQYLALQEQRASALAGRAYLVSGNSTAALGPLQRAIALAETHLDPKRSPRLANTLVALAQALRQDGHGEAAQAALDRAKAILLSHPSLSAR